MSFINERKKIGIFKCTITDDPDRCVVVPVNGSVEIQAIVVDVKVYTHQPIEIYKDEKLHQIITDELTEYLKDFVFNRWLKQNNLSE